MSSIFEIPFASGTPQTFSIALAGATYQFTLVWNEACASWVLDIANSNGTPILSGIPLVTGTDLLAPFAYLEFGVSLYVQTDNDPLTVPTFSSMGITGHLYAVAP